MDLLVSTVQASAAALVGVVRPLIAAIFWIVGVMTIGKAGVLYAAMFTMAQGVRPVAWSHDNLRLSLWYTGGVLAILAAHEGGHWWMCRKHGVRTSGPFLIPVPISWANLVSWLWLPAIGTLGAFLRARQQGTSRVAQWEVALAGLAAGFAVTVCCTALGFAWSIELHRPAVMGRFWRPHVLDWLTDGKAWHPIMSAAWVGWGLTTTSLIPIVPFDGGRLFWNLPAVWTSHRKGIVLLGLICLLCWL